MPGQPAGGPLTPSTVVDLFDRLDVLHERLRDNAERWFLSGGDCTTELLNERDRLHDERRRSSRSFANKRGGVADAVLLGPGTGRDSTGLAGVSRRYVTATPSVEGHDERA
jgi:hypothetical protein